MTARFWISMPDGPDAIYIFTITAEILARSLANFLSTSEETHEIVIYATRQGARADNLTIC